MNVGACAAAACSVLVPGATRDRERLKESDMFIQKRLYTQQSHLIIAASFFNLRVVACTGEKKELHSYTKNVGSLPGTSTAQIKDGVKDDHKKGTATCRLTSPNPPPFQLNPLLHRLRTTPNTPAGPARGRVCAQGSFHCHQNSSAPSWGPRGASPATRPR